MIHTFPLHHLSLLRGAMVSCPCCVGRQNKRPPPSVEHADAETAFANVIAKEVARLQTRMTVCDILQALDDQVHHGVVRRQAAGHFASTLWPVSLPLRGCYFFPSTLLRCILQPMKHKVEHCNCVETVLAWGCCPTVLTHCAEASEVRCALAVVGRQRWARSLLRWGSLPWPGFGVTAGPWSLAPTAECAWMHRWDELGSEVQAAQAQWPRWHWRCCKRQWVALVVCHPMPTFVA
jgi:hypothetical protein